LTDPWKIGAASGLIAGIIAGIVAFIFIIISVIIGLDPTPGYPLFPLFSITEIATIEIILSTIWGVIFGVIYSKIYYTIPGKSYLKALFFSVILWLIVSVRPSVIMASYGLIIPWTLVWSFMGFFKLLSYGLVLGSIYEFLSSRYYVSEERPKIVQYDWKGGIFPGVIAGIFGGIGGTLSWIIAYNLRAVINILDLVLEVNLGVPFFISHLGYMIGTTALWGVLFGAIYAKVYNLVPGRGMIKGIYYALVLWLISNIHSVSFFMVYGNITQAKALTWVGFLIFIFFGIVIGALYKKE